MYNGNRQKSIYLYGMHKIEIKKRYFYSLMSTNVFKFMLKVINVPQMEMVFFLLVWKHYYEVNFFNNLQLKV